MKLLISSIATILLAITYRAGGMSKDDTTKPTWIPKWLRNTKTRDLGCPLVCLSALLLMGIQTAWWIHMIVFLIMFGALTTYWDKIFGYDNFYLHGLAIGLAYLPYLMVIPWYLLIIRAIIMGLFMGIWCKVFSNDLVEEYGRGGIIGLTLILL